MARRNPTSEWLPFAILASGLVAIAVGAKARWRLSGEQADAAPSNSSTPVQAGVIKGWV